MPKKPKLTVKERKLVKGVAEGKTKRQAAIDAGYSGSPETVSVTASEVLRKPKVQEALEAALIKHGITLDRAIAPIGEALDAQKVVIVGKGDDAFADVTPDHSVRLQASDRALKLMGVGQQQSGVTNNFLVIAKDDREKYFSDNT